ncbi:type III pantothenate kinase [Puniceicoccaceae bacterium K14]|nr:type III pantothenate kinase [Puniceicoccaceae bacterium K14]
MSDEVNLCIDIGNSQMHGGVYSNGEMITQFRKETSPRTSRDELGLFLVSVLKEMGIDPKSITRIGMCCVVPDLVYSLKNASRIYFGVEPLLLEAGVKTKLKIKTKNPLEVGADRIANAIATSELYPDRDALIVDFGTAITFDAVSADKEYLGGSICAGMGLSMEALGSKTAKLPFVEITNSKRALGKSTIECIQGGLYFGYLGLIKELVGRIRDEAFGDKNCLVIATGGMSQLYRNSGLFDVIVPDLVLQGINVVLAMNPISNQAKEYAD